jgi:hypothetical protein
MHLTPRLPRPTVFAPAPWQRLPGEPGAKREFFLADFVMMLTNEPFPWPGSASLESVKERGGQGQGGEAAEEERSISDLLLDGIEFAEVILLNKVGLAVEQNGAS